MTTKRTVPENGMGEGRSIQSRVFEASVELRALAHLFEAQGSGALEAAPLDMDEVCYGVGMLLNRLARKMRRAAIDLDEEECRRAIPAANRGA